MTMLNVTLQRAGVRVVLLGQAAVVDNEPSQTFIDKRCRDANVTDNTV